MKDEFKEKRYQFNEYVLGYDKGGNDRSALTISKVLNGNMYVMATLTDGSADVISLILDKLNKELQATKEDHLAYDNLIKDLTEENQKYRSSINRAKEKIKAFNLCGIRCSKTWISKFSNELLKALDGDDK